jgi:glutamine synthetase
MKEIESRVNDKFSEQDEVILKMDIHKSIPELFLDNTDRNRTSPFAFTGNKFEFRAVGSTANCAGPMMVLNTIMADTLVQFKKDVDALIKKKGEKKEIAILHVLRTYIKKSKSICFEGDNYSDEWAKEAKKRGLSNNKDTVRALDVLATKEAKNLFSRMEIFSDVELEARHEIQLEEYVKKIQIEARMIGYLATNHVLPSAIEYQNKLIKNIIGQKEIGLPAKSYASVKDIVAQMSGHINAISGFVTDMVNERKKANKLNDSHKKAVAYCDKIKPYFDKIRYHADKLELIVEDKTWALPKLRELLFLR